MNAISALIATIAVVFKEKNWQLVTAESCTGGLIASSITAIPGSSAWFDRGFVTYSNLAKQEMLGVPAELIAQFGAVSIDVAIAMAEGALRQSAGDLAVAVTGIAGPDGGSLEKPVGTVCLAWATHNTGTHALRKQFSGDRQDIRRASCEQALQGIVTLVEYGVVPE